MKDACAESRTEGEKAPPLDPASGEAIGFLAYARHSCDFDNRGATEGLKRALDLVPSSANLHDNLAWVLSCAGRHDEALEHSRIAVGLDPLSDLINVHLGAYLERVRRHDEAERSLRNVLAATPDSVFAKFTLGNCLTAQGRYDEALAVLLSRKVPRPEMNFAVGYALGRAGRKAEARRVLEFLLEKRKAQFVPPAMIAIVYAGLGETDKAFEWLEIGYEERGIFVDQAKIDPLFDPLRGDPRFEAFVKKVGI